jgi:glycosyltransferase involved in cell wall biosynthesis
MNNKLYIITNESISYSNNDYFCDNLDLKSIPEALHKKIEVNLIGRRSKKKRTKKISIENIKISKNIFGYLFLIFKSLKNKKSRYLIISISPFTFLACVFLKIFGIKPYVYLRSDGYEEYKAILGFIGKTIYHLMFLICSNISNLISCRKHILRKKKGEIVSPSHLNNRWFENILTPEIASSKLLYVGRIRVEKGIFSLMKILKNSKISLTIITSEKNIKIPIVEPNITIVSFENYNDQIIKFYDDHNILILPSYTEGHPQVLDEALARHRPVIIFEDISHVTRDRVGIFITERNINSLKDTIKNILKNYTSIQKDMNKNILPTKKNFIEELERIILR